MQADTKQLTVEHKFCTPTGYKYIASVERPPVLIHGYLQCRCHQQLMSIFVVHYLKLIMWLSSIIIMS